MTRLTREEWDTEVQAIKSATGIPLVYIESMLKAMCARGWMPAKKEETNHDDGEGQSG